jgi:peptidoglycan/LPS O-acetylase OafA/YrhL
MLGVSSDMQRARTEQTPARPPTAAHGKRRDIEGMRAIAILAVVLYHVGVVNGGYVGVDVFFVVSGFLITGLLWREVGTTGRLGFARFYARRARRLLPAAALVLVATLLASAVIVSPLRLADIARDAESAAVYLSNYRFAAQKTSYLTATTPPSPLQNYWSLAVEEQFYILWPVLMLGVAMLARRARDAQLVAFAALTSVAIASFLLCVHQTRVSQPWAFFGLPSRAWELALGGLLALAVPVIRQLPKNIAAVIGWLGLFAIVWSALVYSDSTLFPGTAALVPVLGAAAVIMAGTARTRLGPVLVLRHRPFQVTGRLSYSWYLWHWPVLILVAARWGRGLNVAEGIAFSLLSLVLAALTFLVVERPIRFAPRLRQRPQRSLVLGGALSIAVLVAAVFTANSVHRLDGGGPSAETRNLAAAAASRSASVAAASTANSSTTTTAPPIDSEAAGAIRAAIATQKVPSNLQPDLRHAAGDKPSVFVNGCNDTYTETVVRECAYGDKASTKTVVLVGDSHAAQWEPALAAVAQERGWRLVAVSKATCPPVEISVFSPILGRQFRECDRWRVAVRDRIRREHPFLVVVGSARHYTDVYHFQMYGPEWVDGMGRYVRELREITPNVVVMGPTPKPDQDVPGCLAQHLTSVPSCVQPRAGVVDVNGSNAERVAVTAAGGDYLPVVPLLCTKTQCPVIVGNLLVYRDDNHLSKTFASWLAPLIGEELDRAMAQHG